jgi:hypothetical protein
MADMADQTALDFDTKKAIVEPELVTSIDVDAAKLAGSIPSSSYRLCRSCSDAIIMGGNARVPVLLIPAAILCGYCALDLARQPIYADSLRVACAGYCNWTCAP